MRTHTSFFAMLVLAVAAFAIPASAQDTKFDVHVPFGFKAGKVDMPAGDYRIQRQSSRVIYIRNVDTSESVILQTQPLDYDATSANSALVFNRYDGSYFLAQVRSFDGTQTYKLVPSVQERQLATISVPTVVAVHTRSR